MYKMTKITMRTNKMIKIVGKHRKLLSCLYGGETLAFFIDHPSSSTSLYRSITCSRVINARGVFCPN